MSQKYRKEMKIFRQFLKGSTDAIEAQKPREEFPAVETPPAEESEQDNGKVQETDRNLELREALRKRRLARRGRTPKSKAPDGAPKASEGYGRATTIVNTAKMQQLREIAFQETLTIKEVIEAAFDKIIADYEAQHGPLVPNPEKWGPSMTRPKKGESRS